MTEKQRCQIWALKKRDWSQRVIAREIGVSQPTISREPAHNRGGRGYRSQQMAEERRRQARKPTKMLSKASGGQPVHASRPLLLSPSVSAIVEI
ncbi:hypothetical protein ACJJIK_01255 [Microbulbifer sp. ZKSA006]|uniref:hypothetical protein n=1 Tax=Microbulbifer sp. ZKSA006 TaxID=3243390 RepID=UPI0040398D40